MRVFLCCRFCFSGHFEFSFYFLTPRSSGTISNLIGEKIKFLPKLYVLFKYKQLSHMQVAFPKKVYTYVVLKTNLGYFLQKIGWDKSQTSPSIPPGLTPKQEEEKMELSPKAKPWIRKVRTSRGHLSVEKRTIPGDLVHLIFF